MLVLGHLGPPLEFSLWLPLQRMHQALSLNTRTKTLEAVAM